MMHFRKNQLDFLFSRDYDLKIIAPKDIALTNLQFPLLEWKLSGRSINIFSSLIELFNLFIIIFRIKNRPDARFIVFSPKPSLFLLIIGFIFRLNVIVVLTGLGTLFINNSRFLKLLKHFFLFLLGKSLKIICLNPEDKKLIKNLLKSSNVKIELLPGEGVFTKNYFNLINNSIHNEKIFSNIDHIKILYLGRLIYDKGIVEFLEVANLLKNKSYDFYIAGPIPDKSDKFISNLLLDSLRDGLVNYVGPIDDVKNFISSFDILVLPSYREGISTVLIEAAMCGIPFIASDVPGCSDLMPPKYKFLLFNPQNYDALAKSLILFNNLSKNEKISLAKTQKDFIYNNYLFESVEPLLIDIYCK
jgi:glycosyltransferase involved in cell wall biosynthesis